MKRVLCAVVFAVLSCVALCQFPPGDLLGPCRQSPPFCNGAGICLSGMCMPQSDDDESSGSGQCSQACGPYQQCIMGQCIGGPCESECIGMQSCTLGICTDFAKRGQAGQILGSCINGACASDQLTCLAGQVCIPATKPKCTNNAMCNGQHCITETGKCEKFQPAPLNCGYKCGEEEECFYGNCIARPARPPPCAPECNRTWGDTCVSVGPVSMCVRSSFNDGMTCGLDCNYPDECQAAPVFMNAPPKCMRKSAGTGRCDKDHPCGSAYFCDPSFEQCVECDDTCQALRIAISGGNNSAVVDSDLFSNLYKLGLGSSPEFRVMDPAATAAAISNGVLNLPPNAMLDIDSSVTGINSLRMAAESADSAARISSILRVNELQVSTGINRIQLDGQLAADRLNVAEGSSLAVNVGDNARLDMSALSLSGPLNLLGSSTDVLLRFPASASSVSVGPSGSISINNAVGVSGAAGSVPLRLVSYTTRMETQAGGSFSHSGPIHGHADAKITVRENSTMTLAGNLVEPDMEVQPGAKLRINTLGGSGPQRFGFIDFTIHERDRATLELDGSRTSGANLYFKEMRWCPIGLTVRYNIDGSAAAAIKDGLTLFNYGAGTFSNLRVSTTLFACTIQVCGSKGGCVTVKNPYNDEDSSARRRLLADSGAADATASFEPTKLTVSGGAGDPGAAAAIAAQPMLLLALAFAACIAMMRM